MHFTDPMAHFDQDESNCRKKRKSLKVLLFRSNGLFFRSKKNVKNDSYPSVRALVWLTYGTDQFSEWSVLGAMHAPALFFYFQASKWPISRVAPCGLKKTRSQGLATSDPGTEWQFHNTDTTGPGSDNQTSFHCGEATNENKQKEVNYCWLRELQVSDRSMSINSNIVQEL